MATNPNIENGRIGALKRWAGRSQADKDAAAAHAREAMRSGAVTRAREQAQRLGITLTDKQAEQAGATLLRAEQRDRMETARVAAEAAKAAQRAESNADWATDQLVAFHALLRAWAPNVPAHQQANILAMAVRDELDAPDGFSRPRLIRRLRILVEHVKAQSAERSRQLAVPGDAQLDELFDSIGKPDPARKSGLLSDLSEEEQAEVVEAAKRDGHLS